VPQLVHVPSAVLPARPAHRKPAIHEGHGRRRHDSGTAAVEMALVLPLLLLLIFGIIDFGRMLNKQIAITAAAQEGARVAALGGDREDRDERVKAIAGDDVAITGGVCPAGAAAGDADITVTHTFRFVTPVGLIGGGFDGEVTLTGRGVMPCH